MAELVAAIGLALAIEGLFCAAAPDVARRAMAEAAQAPRERLRLTGIVTAVLGVAIVWGARKVGL
jgi:uncharacterized protein